MKNLNLCISCLVTVLSINSCKINENKEFLNEIGVSTSVLNAGILSEHGYAFIEENVGRFLMPSKSEEDFNEMLQQAQKAPLRVKACNSFIPGSLKSVGPEAVHVEILKYMETAFRRAQRAGVEYIVYGSGGSRAIPDGFPRDNARQQFIDLCSQMAPVAAKYDVVVVLEPLNTRECNFINSVTEGGEIVEEVNHPNFRLLADIYHMLMEDEGPESIKRYGHLIAHTHIAEKKDRSTPGTHNENFTAYFKALKDVDYKGKISIESRWEDLEAQASGAITSMRNQLSTLK